MASSGLSSPRDTSLSSPRATSILVGVVGEDVDVGQDPASSVHVYRVYLVFDSFI